MPPTPPPPVDGGRSDTGPIDAGALPEVIVTGETNLTAIDVRGGEIVWATRNPDAVRRRLIAKGGTPADLPLTVEPVVVRLDPAGTVWIGGDEPAGPGLERITTTGPTLFGDVHPTGLALGNGGAWYVDANRQKLGFLTTGSGLPAEGSAGSPFDVASNGALTCWTTDVGPSSQGILWTNDATQPGKMGITTLGNPEAVAMSSSPRTFHAQADTSGRREVEAGQAHRPAASFDATHSTRRTVGGTTTTQPTRKPTSVP